jgi:hypothetical protein
MRRVRELWTVVALAGLADCLEPTKRCGGREGHIGRDLFQDGQAGPNR